MKKNAFDTIFLDTDYLRDLSIIAKKEGLITASDYADSDLFSSLPNKRPTGYKQLLFWLMMYEHLDSSLSEYSWDAFIDKGIIEETSCIIHGYGGKKDDGCVSEAKKIATFYKNDFIKGLKNLLSKSGSWYGDDLYFYDYSDLSATDRFKGMIFDAFPGNFSLKNDFEIVFDGLVEGSFRSGYNPNKDITPNQRRVPYKDLNIERTTVRMFYNLIDSIYCSRYTNVAYASKLFKFSKNQTIMDDLSKIYLIQCNYISDLQIIPVPETLEDVFKFRSDPNLISFRKVMNTWINYLENGDYETANKMKKDLKKANEALSSLEKYKRVSNHMVSRTFKLAGTLVPYLLAALASKEDNIDSLALITAGTAVSYASDIADVAEYIESCVIDKIEEKYKWSLMVKA